MSKYRIELKKAQDFRDTDNPIRLDVIESINEIIDGNPEMDVAKNVIASEMKAKDLMTMYAEHIKNKEEKVEQRRKRYKRYRRR